MIKIPRPERHPKKLVARFYATAGGSEPVREWLKGLAAEDCKMIGDDIATVVFGWPIGMPFCRPLSGGLFEVRSMLAGHRIARVLFCTAKGELLLLHGFEKKTRNTPVADLALAKKRMKEIAE